jgi:uncharacterized coiled-coil protein SlyX
MLLKQQVTREQALEISQRRRTLELRVRALETDFAKQQDIVSPIGHVLRNPSAHHGQTRAEKERAKLKVIANTLFDAECDLADYNSANPSEHQLMELERLRVQAENRKREVTSSCQQQQQ